MCVPHSRDSATECTDMEKYIKVLTRQSARNITEQFKERCRKTTNFSHKCVFKLEFTASYTVYMGYTWV